MRGGNCEKKAVIICVAVLLTVTCLAADLYLYQIIREIDRREVVENEEPAEYFGSGYDGFNEN